MHIFVIFMIVFTILLIVEAIILGILKSTRSSTQTSLSVPNLQDAYDASKFNDGPEIDDPAKPFRIVSGLQSAVVSKNAFTFNNATANTRSFANNSLVGFRFRAKTYFNIVSLQYIAQFSPVNSKHQIAIYDLSTMQEITSPLDNIVDSNIDPIDKYGFVTHVLTTPIQITALQSYAIVTLVNTNDKYGTSAMAQLLNLITIENNVISVPFATMLSIPQTFGPPENVEQFVSFETQRPLVVESAVFDIDLATGGYARFPPGYVRGLTLSVPFKNAENVIITSGVALSQFGEANIIVPLELSVSTNNGANGLDTGVVESGKWYYVYVIGSSIANNTKPAGLLSLGASEPALLPPGYDIFRRLGSILAQFFEDEQPEFLPIEQEGDGSNRTTLYTSNVLDNFFYTTTGPTSVYIPVPIVNAGDATIALIPPQATQLILNVAVEPGGANNNLVVRFRKRLQTTEGVWVVSVPNAQESFSQLPIGIASIPLPQELEYGIFPNLGGVVPPSFFARFYATGYFETI